MDKKLFIFFFIITHVFLFAIPEKAEVVRGNIKMELTADCLQINAKGRAIINWKSFDVAQNETVLFNQTHENYPILNRVMNGSTTEILGALQSTAAKNEIKVTCCCNRGFRK